MLTLLGVLAALLVAGMIVVRGWKRETQTRAVLDQHNLDEAQQWQLLQLSCDWVWRADAGLRIQLLDQRFANATGLSPTDVIQRPPWEQPWQVINGADWQAVREIVARQETLELQIAYIDQDGQPRYMEWVGTPIIERGECTGYIGIGRDITETIRAAEKLNDSQNRYDMLLNAVTEVVFRTDNLARLTLLSPTWQDLTGHPLDTSLGRPLLEFFHPDDRQTAQQLLTAILHNEAPATQGQLRMRTSSGGMCWVSLRARPVFTTALSEALASRSRDASAPQGVLGTLNDISTIKIAELNLRNINLELEARVRARTIELEASNRELEAFSYSVSHDLRSPLRSIDGFTRLLEEDLGERLDDQSRSHLERIRSAAARMSKLTDELLELARFARRPLQRQTVNLSKIAEQIMEDLCAQYPDRDVELTVTSDLLAIADPVQMQVVLENLLNNAWKFTEDRHPARISFTASVDNDVRVFCVSDNGVGFSMACADKLFRPFYRLHADQRFTGSGVGLANVERAILRHGGRVWAESEPDQGARFFFTLNDSAATKQPDQPDTKPPSVTNLTNTPAPD